MVAAISTTCAKVVGASTDHSNFLELILKGKQKMKDKKEFEKRADG